MIISRKTQIKSFKCNERGEIRTTKASNKTKDIDVKKLIEILPKLIKENDTVKGAILSALSGVVATRDDIKDLIREMDKRFEQVDKRFEQVDKQFEQVDKRLDQITVGADVSFELFCIEMIKKIYAAEGNSIPYIEQRRHFTDEEMVVHPGSTDVEIDLFYLDPLLIGEVTYRVDSIEKLDVFLAKIAFMEHEIFKKPARRYFCALEINPAIHDAFQKKAKKNQVEVITKQLK
ncbi:MAG TPA: hypothetical protein VKM55_11260 [Candidatus Lokiarchaeia archaeon]|nr:hypothetical protein [Candidatus Lokiarchaeia archaeon]